jgi:hypothetical protein
MGRKREREVKCFRGCGGCVSEAVAIAAHIDDENGVDDGAAARIDDVNDCDGNV